MKYIKITSIILLAIIVVAAPITFYFYISRNSIKNTEEVNLNEINLLSENTKSSQAFVANTNQENIQGYLEKLNQDIEMASSSSRTTQNLLKLRKAIVLAINRDENFGKNIISATDIFIDIINDEATDNSKAGHYISDFAKVAMTIPYLECCTSNSADPYLFTKKIENQTSTYFNYKKNGYTEYVSKLLALDDLTQTISPDNANDISNKRNQMDIETKLLLLDKDSLDAKTRQKIIKELKENLDNYINFKAITYKDIIMTTLKPQSMHAYSFDIYSQNIGNIDSSLNKKIDQNYNTIRNTSLESLGSSTDPISFNEIQYYNDLRQLYSTGKRYHKSQISTNETYIIEDTLSRIDSSKEMRALANNYFHSKEFANKEIVGHVYFASLRSQNKKIDTYLKSIGI